MNVRRIARFLTTLASTLVFLAALSARAKTPPVADHHAHLRSPTAARLLNEGARREPHRPGRGEEKPSIASALIAQLDAAGVRRSVALSDSYRLGSPFVHVHDEAAAVDAENEWTLGQVRTYPDRLVGFCSANPLRSYALAAIEHCAAIGLRGGLKLHLANAGFNFDDSAQIRQLGKVFAIADRLRMPILIHLRSDDVWRAKRNVEIFLTQVLPLAPHIPVQVAHLGGWGGYDQATDETLSTFAGICQDHSVRCHHLYFDISAVVLSPAFRNAVPGSDDRLLWDQQKDFADGPARLVNNLRRIGLSRILFGTDWPNATVGSYVDTLHQNLRLSPTELNQILGNVAPYFRESGIDPHKRRGVRFAPTAKLMSYAESGQLCLSTFNNLIF